MILRFSTKLGGKIHEVPSTTAEFDGGYFADWSGHLFRFDRTQYILVVNSHSLFSTTIYGRGVTDFNTFFSSWSAQLRELHSDYGLKEIYDCQVAPTMGNIRISKVGNRSITGSLNELCIQAKSYLGQSDLSPYDISIRLNNVPMSAIDMKSPLDYYRSLTPQIVI